MRDENIGGVRLTRLATLRLQAQGEIMNGANAFVALGLLGAWAPGALGLPGADGLARALFGSGLGAAIAFAWIAGRLYADGRRNEKHLRLRLSAFFEDLPQRGFSSPRACAGWFLLADTDRHCVTGFLVDLERGKLAALLEGRAAYGDLARTRLRETAGSAWGTLVVAGDEGFKLKVPAATVPPAIPREPSG